MNIDNETRVYLWRGEFNDIVHTSNKIELYVLAETRGEAEIKLKLRADKLFDDYEYFVCKIEEDKDGIMDCLELRLEE